MGGRFELRVDDFTKERWKDAAAERGYSLAEFVWACVEAELVAPSPRMPVPAPPARTTSDPGPSGKRSYVPDFKQERKKKR